MKTITKAALMGLMTVAAAGCATVDHAPQLGNRIATDAVSLNESYGQATQAVILNNILRARDRWPTTYTTLSGIQSQPQLNRNSSFDFGPLGLGNAIGPFTASKMDFGSNARELGQYKVSPFSSDAQKTPTVLQPVQPELFKEYFDRWPKDVTLLMFVNQVFKKTSHASNGEERIQNDGEDVQGFKFKLGKALGVDPNEIHKFDINKHVKLVNITTPKDCADIYQKPGQSPKSFMEYAALLKSAGNVSVKVKPVKSAVNLLKKDSVYLEVCKSGESDYALQLNEEALEISHFHSKQMLPKIGFELRSLDSMVYYIGETLRTSHKAGRHIQKPVFGHCKEPKLDRYGRQIYDKNGPVILKESAPLFVTHDPGRFSDLRYAVHTNYAGDVYAALPNASDIGRYGGCLNERSSTVMTILNQILLLSQSPDALKSPEDLFLR